MKLRTLDKLACPVDKHFPLDLNIIKSNKRKSLLKESSPLCEKYCKNKDCLIKKKDTFISLDCNKCTETEIVEGILSCSKCKRWYPIIDEIPIILTDKERLKDVDLEFLEKNLKHFDKDLKNIPKSQTISEVKKVQDFWNNHVCMGTWDEEDTQFDYLDEWRYVRHPWLKELLKFENYPKKHLLEIGCSQGLDLSQFCKNKSFVLGLDLTPNGIKLAKKRMKRYKLEDYSDFVIGNAECSPIRTEAFDMIYSFGVIHHSKDTATAIKEIQRSLKPKGRTTIMVYYTYSITQFLDASARLLNRILIAITGDKDIVWKIFKIIPLKTKDKDSLTSFRTTGYSAILHAPYSTTFSKREIKHMLKNFKNIKITLNHLHPVVLIAFSKFPFILKFLANNFGFHINVTGIKKNTINK